MTAKESPDLFRLPAALCTVFGIGFGPFHERNIHMSTKLKTKLETSPRPPS